MARRRRREASAEGDARDIFTQQDEADVVAAVGAETDPETGELAADPKKVMEAGAVDAESIRENQRIEDYVGKKRGNVDNVPFNVGDVLTKYDTILKLLSANAVEISVKRMTGTQVQYRIISSPRSGAELYDAIMQQVHGAYEEAMYEVRFVDKNSKIFRGIGRITLPDTRGSAPQQGQQPMNPFNPYAPHGYPPPYPAGAPQGYPSGYSPNYPPTPMPPPAAAPTQQQPQVVVHPPASPGFEEMLATMRQMYEFMRTMAPTPAMPQPQQPVVPPPPPPPGTPDMASMMAWMRQMHEFAQTMSGQPPGVAIPQQPQTPGASMATMMAVPPMTPPPGTMWIPGLGFAPIERVMQLFAPPGYGAPGYGGARMGPGAGPSYGPRAYQGQEGAQAPGARAEAPQRPQDPTHQFRDALALVKTVGRMAQEITEITGGGGGDAPEVPLPQEDNSPIKIIDTGHAKVLVNASDGKLRGVETMWANIDKIFKWAGEQGEAFRKAQVEKEARQAPVPRQLPPGFIEVGPDFQPPPGMVAAVVDPSTIPYAPPQQGLPPPPTNVPPPVQARREWGAPVIPFRQGE